MLTTDQKEAILRKAGIAVHALPSRNLSAQQQQADAKPLVTQSIQADGRPDADAQRARTIDVLFAEYSAARAAASLREAEAVRQMGMRPHPASGSTA